MIYLLVIINIALVVFVFLKIKAPDMSFLTADIAVAIKPIIEKLIQLETIMIQRFESQKEITRFQVSEIIEDKFILNINCSMWNKMNDINMSFSYIKEQIKADNKLALISFDDAYNYYYKFCNSKSFKFIVSKRYFEKYLYFKLADHIVYEKFIDSTFHF